MYDKNASGSIDVNEFQQLFSAINQWKGVFQGYDKDRSGTIEQSELSQGKMTKLLEKLGPYKVPFLYWGLGVGYQ